MEEDGKSFYRLEDVMEHITNTERTTATVYCDHGNIPHQNKTEILSTFKVERIAGYTEHEETYVLSLKDLLKKINTTEISAFHMENVQIRNRYGKLTEAQKIIKIAHTRNVAKKMLRYMSPYAITSLYNKIPFVLNNRTLKGKARKAISTFFKKNMDYPYQDHSH